MNKCKCVNEVKQKEKNIENESFAMFCIKENSKNFKKLFIITMATLVCLIGTVIGFLLYLNQYEFIGENEAYTVEQRTDGTGNLNNYGDITNGVPKNNND